MKPKTIEVIQDEVASERVGPFYKDNGLRKWRAFDNNSDAWLEVCKRYAIEVAKASLEKASENGKIKREKMLEWSTKTKETCSERFFTSEYEFYQIDKDTITDEQNIVL